MRTTITLPAGNLVALWLLGSLLASLVGSLRAQGESDIAALWKDPVFKKQFVASYGVNAEVEPRVTKDEVAILEQIRPLMADDLPGAEKTLKGEMKPDCSAILDFTLGGIQFQQDRMADALANYQRAVQKFPSFRRAFRNLGLIHARNGSYDLAIAAFTRMIELGGGDGYAFGLLGFSYASKEDYQPAEAAYRNALLLAPDNIEWRLGLTRCVWKQGKFEDAATLLDALLARYPDKAEFWLLQAHTYVGMKQPLKAAENFEAVDRLGKSTVDSLHTLGDIYVREQLPELAAGAYLRAIDRDPAQPAARPLRAAEVLAACGAFTEARLVVAKVKQVCAAQLQDGEKKRLLRLEARLLMADGSDSPEAVAALDEVVRLDPLDGDALMLLGQYHQRHGEPDRAILFFERAANVEAFEIKARIGHAQVLVGQGRYGEALPLLRRAQELKPREDVARYLEQVERFARSKR